MRSSSLHCCAFTSTAVAPPLLLHLHCCCTSTAVAPPPVIHILAYMYTRTHTHTVMYMYPHTHTIKLQVEVEVEVEAETLFVDAFCVDVGSSTFSRRRRKTPVLRA